MEEIKKFHFRSIKTPARIVILGSTGTGKSTVVKWILYYKQKYFRLASLVSQTADINGEYPMIQDALTFSSYDPAAMEKLLNYSGQTFFKQKEKNRHFRGKIIENLLILDDVLGDKKWKKDTTLEKIFFQGRQVKKSLIISLQDLMQLPPSFREQISYLFITRMTTKAGRDKLYKHYFNQSLCTFAEFENIVKACTTGYNIAVFDYTKMNNAEKVSDCIYYAPVKDPRKLPNFSVGAPGINNAIRKFTDKHWRKHLFSPASQKSSVPSKKNTQIVLEE